MQGKYILLVLVVILLISPAWASTNKIYGGAPVFIGESNLDISKALDGCRIVAWWPEGAQTTFPPAKNITLRPVNEFPDSIFHYTVSPVEYANYTGNWYCEDVMPLRVVFVLKKPEVKISVWDVDEDKDISGRTILSTSNITYRIDTNLDSALQYKYRPDLTPADSIWTVKLIDPYGKSITNIYTGSAGATGTQILTFDSAPRITSTPYIWKNGAEWDLDSRNAGGYVYPAGRYILTASHNLNGMEATYKSAGISDVDGKLSNSADITIEKAPMVLSTPAPVTTGITTVTTEKPEEIVPGTTTIPATVPVNTIPEKTTYAPLPAWIALFGLVIAGIVTGIFRK